MGGTANLQNLINKLEAAQDKRDDMSKKYAEMSKRHLTLVAELDSEILCEKDLNTHKLDQFNAIMLHLFNSLLHVNSHIQDRDTEIDEKTATAEVERKVRADKL